MMSGDLITVGELSSFLMYAAFVGVSVSGKLENRAFVMLTMVNVYLFEDAVRLWKSKVVRRGRGRRDKLFVRGSG